MSKYTYEIRERMIGAGNPNQAPITVTELRDLLEKLEAMTIVAAKAIVLCRYEKLDPDAIKNLEEEYDAAQQEKEDE